MTELNEEQQQIEQNIVSFSNKMEALTVYDDETLQEAGTALIQVKTYEKKVIETFGPAKEASFRAYKEMLALYNKAMKPLEQIERFIKPMIGRYQSEQRRIAAEAQRKAQAEAQRAAEDERLAQARALEVQGEDEASDAILDIPVVAPVVVLPPPPKVAGVSMRDNWKAEVLDIKALCKAVGSGKAEPGYVLPNMKVLNQMAKALKGNAFSKIAGVRAVKEQVVSGRSL